jgi:YVTN family beta-propeller protein
MVLTLLLAFGMMLGQAATLEGYVKDGLTGLPVVGAAVGFAGPSPGGSISDASGHYVIPGIPFSGPLTVTASVTHNPAYAVTTRNLNLPASSQIIYRDFTLFPNTPIVVSTTDDVGPGSLFQAVAEANTNSDMSYIMFDIPVSPPTIRPTPSRLLSITEDTWIDATTQPETGYVEIDGTNAGTGGGANGLMVLGHSCRIRGLVINRFKGVGIELAGCNNAVIEGCRIGTDPGGSQAHGNEGGGILLWGTSNSHIGGSSVAARNIISANGSSMITPGIYIYDNANGNHIEGNFIGIASDGIVPLGNNADGVWVNDSHDNVIGGDSPSMGNLISCNSGNGVHIMDETSTGNKVIGNLIGTNFDGTSAKGNLNAGVRLNDAPNNIVGGVTVNQRNVISGNVLGVVIQGPAGASHATGNLVVGNYIGTDVGGGIDLGNTATGISIETGAFNNTIGGTLPAMRNVISGNEDGIRIVGPGTSGNLVKGNYVGTDATGNNAIGNHYRGIAIEYAERNVVGGGEVGAGNVVSANANVGINLDAAPRNTVQGNIIGLNALGTTSIGHQLAGIWFGNNPGSSENTIGGTNMSERNIISGNAAYGIGMLKAQQNTILGNFVGVDRGGTVARGNGYDHPAGSGFGILLVESYSNVIGGSSAGSANVVAGNIGNGISIMGEQSTANLIVGNRIGTDLTGNLSLGNTRHGIHLGYPVNDPSMGPPRNTIVGGRPLGEGNIIAHNGEDGVLVEGGTGQLIVSNSIYANGGLGIDLGRLGSTFSGVTLNDSFDADTGPNDFQNFPLIDFVQPGSGYLRGSLASQPSTTYRVEFFKNSTADPSGYGEGQLYLGSTNVTTNANGSVVFTVSLPTTFAAGDVITATATDPANNTSEFAQDYAVVAPSAVHPNVGFTAAEFATGLIEPEGMAIDQNGNLVVALRGTGEVMRISPSGAKTVLANNFNTPVDVAIDRNNKLYVADLYANGVYAIDLATWNQTIDIQTSGLPWLQGVPAPTGLRLGPDGWLYVSAALAGPGGKVIKANTPPNAPTPTDVVVIQTRTSPQGIAFASDKDMYLALGLLGQVRTLDVTSTLPAVDSKMRVALDGLSDPAGLDVGLDDKMYVASCDKVVTSRPGSQTYTTFLTGLSGGKFNDVLCAPNGDIYVSDVAGGRILRVRAPKEQMLAGNTLSYKINADGDPLINDGSDLTAIRNGFRHWNDVTTSTLLFVDAGTTTQKIAVSGDGNSIVTFTDDQFPFPPFVLAVSAKTIQVGTSPGTATITDADIIFNPAYSNGSEYSFGTDTKYGLYDIESIVAHESGHCVGLVHSGVPSATMFFVLQQGTGARTLTHDDEAWVSRLYPEQTFLNSFGTISGQVVDGYHQPNGVAGALVLAIGTTNSDSIHAYSDGDGLYSVPGLSPGNYKLYIHPLDGNVFGYPLTAAHISAYLQTLTKITDFPEEFYNGTSESSNPVTDIPTNFTNVSVTAGQTTSGINVITNEDRTAPTIVSVFPNNGATDAQVAGELLVTFSEPINKQTVTSSTFSLKESAGGNPVSGTALFLSQNTVLVFTPSSPLAYNTMYTVTILPGITDARGNSLASPYTSSFRTVLPDAQAPTVEQIVPTVGATDVFITTPVTIVFSESVQPATVTSGFSLMNGGTVPGTFTFEQGTKVAIFKPDVSLAEGATYNIQLRGVKDLGGNTMAGTFGSSFATVLEAAPQIVHFGPYDEEVGVTVKTPVLVDFSEPINTATVTNATFRLTGPSGQVAGTFEYLLNNARVIFRPTTDLDYGKTYSLVVTRGVQDVSSQYLSNPLTTTFTTASHPSVPQIFNIYPSAAVVGAEASINGQGFDPDPLKNLVKFGTVEAVVKTATLNTLTTKVPQGSTTADVTVKVGNDVSAGFAFTVLEPTSDPTNDVVGTVTAAGGTRNGAVTPDGAYAYITNSAANSVSVINLATYQIGDPIGVGTTPMKIAINPAGTYAYVTNYNSNTVSVIDINSGSVPPNKVVFTIPVGINPNGVIVTPDGSRVYVAELTSKRISVIDADHNSGAYNHVVATVSTASGNRSAAVNPDGSLAFFTGTAGLTILDIAPASSTYNQVIANVGSSSGTRDVKVSPDGTLAFVTGDNGKIWIVDANLKGPTFGNVLASVPASAGIRSVTTSPDGTLVYVTDYDQNSVLVYRITSTAGPSTPDFNPVVSTGVALTLVDKITVGSNPEGMVIEPKANLLLVANTGSGNVTILNIGGKRGQYVILGTNSVKLENGVDVRSGNIVVNNRSNGAELMPNYELSVGNMAKTASSCALKANRLRVFNNATVSGSVYCNELDNKGMIKGKVVKPLSLPVYATLPPAATGPSGTTDFTVNTGQTKTLSPGSYRDITVKDRGTLVLSGGVYNTRNMSLGASAKVQFSLPTAVRVAARLSTGDLAVIAPKQGAPVGASDAIFYVAGVNGTSGPKKDQPYAVQIGTNNTISANFYAANGTLMLGYTTTATGSFIAKDVLVGENGIVIFDSYFVKSGTPLAKAGSEPLAELLLPEQFDLAQNFPNPFNPSTTIQFDIPKSATAGVHVSLAVYNMLGQLVTHLVDEDMGPGRYAVMWEGTNGNGKTIATGVYLCRFVAGDFVKTNKMMLLK